MKHPLVLLWRWAAPAAVALVLLLALPGSGRAENHKHHLGFALGYEKHLSDDLKVAGLDFTDAGYGAIAYRLSVLPNLDLTADLRGTVHTEEVNGVDLTLTTGWFGPGVRLVAPGGGIRPYAQANFFVVSESIELQEGDVTTTFSHDDVGFGICGGVDIRASNLLSIPIEVNYMYGKPRDNTSGVGVNVGLTFNFGTLSR